MQTVTALLASLGAATGMALSSPVYATVSALHILGIALLVGGIVLVDLRLVGLVRSLTIEAVVLLRRVARTGALMALATGVLLVSARPHAYVGNPAFLAKLAVVGMALANAILFEAMTRKRPLADLLDRTSGRIAGALSLLLWPTAIGLGRWIAFV
ncbi:MAG: hypothetical protein ACK4M0_07860 [Phreatobacter sp.]